MSSAMLNYDDFDLETANDDRLTLREAIKKSNEIRNNDPGKFVRIKSVGPDEFVIVRLSPSDVYDEWKSRIRQRLSRISRRSTSR